MWRLYAMCRNAGAEAVRLVVERRRSVSVTQHVLQRPASDPEPAG